MVELRCGVFVQMHEESKTAAFLPSEEKKTLGGTTGPPDISGPLFNWFASAPKRWRLTCTDS